MESKINVEQNSNPNVNNNYEIRKYSDNNILPIAARKVSDNDNSFLKLKERLSSANDGSNVEPDAGSEILPNNDDSK